MTRERSPQEEPITHLFPATGTSPTRIEVPAGTTYLTSSTKNTPQSRSTALVGNSVSPMAQERSPQQEGEANIGVHHMIMIHEKHFTGFMLPATHLWSQISVFSGSHQFLAKAPRSAREGVHRIHLYEGGAGILADADVTESKGADGMTKELSSAH
ncbi:hypothetical protein BDP27DRAFT_1366908 [Rhodocollybia butyracea]|uniref:Uncharacterized protein n=1 Tax=Rhodocollybia butyracea TaxID=206335 RepID=A0A9P5PK05_9AGAR|nr:hypothetical protein BDP27DRAFT_1366908 [Rhodocollybia butyracea]